MRPKMLVAFDFSAAAARALEWAADLQKTTGGEPLEMVHAINSRPPGTGEVTLDVLLPSEEEMRGLERTMIAAARKHGASASAQVLIRPSAIGDIILDAARGAGAQLIVVGTHGRTGVRRLVLGSVAEHVLRHATCPVVTVHVPSGG